MKIWGKHEQTSKDKSALPKASRFLGKYGTVLAGLASAVVSAYLFIGSHHGFSPWSPVFLPLQNQQWNSNLTTTEITRMKNS